MCRYKVAGKSGHLEIGADKVECLFIQVFGCLGSIVGLDDIFESQFNKDVFDAPAGGGGIVC